MLFPLLLPSPPTLSRASLTNAGMLSLCDGLVAQENLALETYPHYNVLPDDQAIEFTIQHSLFYAQAYLRLGMIYEARAEGIRP